MLVGEFQDKRQQASGWVGADHLHSLRLKANVPQPALAPPSGLRKVLCRPFPDIIGIIERQAVHPQLLAGRIVAIYAAVRDFWHFKSDCRDDTAPPRAGLCGSVWGRPTQCAPTASAVNCAASVDPDSAVVAASPPVTVNSTSSKYDVPASRWCLVAV